MCGAHRINDLDHSFAAAAPAALVAWPKSKASACASPLRQQAPGPQQCAYALRRVGAKGSACARFKSMSSSSLSWVSSVIVACIEKGAMGATGLYHCM